MFEKALRAVDVLIAVQLHGVEEREPLHGLIELQVLMLYLLHRREGLLIVLGVYKGLADKAVRLVAVDGLGVKVEVFYEGGDYVVERGEVQLEGQFELIEMRIVGNGFVKLIARRGIEGRSRPLLVANLDAACRQIVIGVLGHGVVGRSHFGEVCGRLRVVAGVVV